MFGFFSHSCSWNPQNSKDTNQGRGRAAGVGTRYIESPVHDNCNNEDNDQDDDNNMTPIGHHELMKFIQQSAHT